MNTANYICSACASRFDLRELRCRCTCGALLNYESAQPFVAQLIDSSQKSLLRYLPMLAPMLHDALREISMGEGWTEVVPWQRATEAMIKLDHRMPTSSFKDRGAVMLVAAARVAEAQRIVQDSSGNAGHAVAAYAGQANIPCEIFLPESTSPSKIDLIQSTGAIARLVSGSREDTADAALKAANQPGTFYASHVYNPLFYEGTMTYIFELWEQLEGVMPDNLIVPLGNGTLLLGVVRGLDLLTAAGLLPNPPQLIAVQATRCAPIARAFAAGLGHVPQVENEGTAATGIAIARPLRGAQILAALRRYHGRLITTEETAIDDAVRKLADDGFEVEATTAASFAAYMAHRSEISGTSVLTICGGKK